jgi:hypothetical protein
MEKVTELLENSGAKIADVVEQIGIDNVNISM